jgi:hypothetical protein
MRSISNVIKINLAVWSSLLLLGCSESVTYDYLVMHPKKLELAYSTCQLSNTLSCDMVKQAAHDMGELIYEHENNPETFGKNIMSLQQQLQTMRQQNNFDRQAYDAQLKKLKIMYAVAASQGPE